jgi:hypothetical protein
VPPPASSQTSLPSQTGPMLASVVRRSARCGKKQMQHADAEVEAVEHHVADDHHRNQPEPDETHHGELLSSQCLRSCKWCRSSIGVNRIVLRRRASLSVRGRG